MNETFGQRLARLRKEKGFTQEDIADKINISPQAVSKWENDISSPDIQTLIKLSDIFEVSLDDLLGKEKKGVEVVSPEKRKDINKMTFKIKVNSTDGDKVNVNIPVALIKACLDSGLEMPQVSGKVNLNNIDFKKIFELVEQGVIGELVSIDSADGDHVTITVE
ncbi:MAG: helix-turn-helix transcriptional regulator [Bacilli bacterium]|nr:helix-turn-helix transcriptional regulator [Bacilli bacterium]